MSEMREEINVINFKILHKLIRYCPAIWRLRERAPRWLLLVLISPFAAGECHCNMLQVTVDLSNSDSVGFLLNSKGQLVHGEPLRARLT